eukprot:4135048-Pyramimonas_sp.AAC.1
MVRRQFAQQGHHIDPVPFLYTFEQKCRRWRTIPRGTFSIAGQGQRLHHTRIPLDNALLHGAGRTIKFA